MWPLFACSIIALAIIIERLFALRQSKIIPEELIEELERLIRMGRLGDIEQLLKGSSSPLCPIIMTAIKNAGRSREKFPGDRIAPVFLHFRFYAHPAG